MSFFCLTGGTDNTSCPVWVPCTILFYFGGSFFPSSRWFPHACTYQYSVEYSMEILWRASGVLFLCNFLLYFSVLQGLAAFISPDSHYFLNSGNLQYSAQVLLLCAVVPGSKLGQFAHFVSFPSLRNHCILLIDVQCFQHHCFRYFLIFGCFRQEGRSSPCYSILTWSKNPTHNFSNKEQIHPNFQIK